MEALDRKKEVIILILDKLRGFNYEIGRYEKSILNLHNVYSVKVTNGIINIPSEFVSEFEKNPNELRNEMLSKIAFGSVN